MTLLTITASATGSVIAVRKALKFIFTRPKVPVERFRDIPFNDLAKSAALSRLAYSEPNTLKSNALNYKHVIEDKTFFEDQKFYDGNPVADTQAYVWFVKDKRTAYVFFRGTSSLRDAISDIDVRYDIIDLDENNTNIRVHNGFYDQLMAVYEDLVRDLKSRNGDFDRIYVGGHSLGSGLSVIAVAKFVKDFPTKELHCHTFGSPRVGNTEFVNWFNKNVKNNWRIFNEQDPVPMVPASFRFTHVDNGLCIDEKCVLKEAKKDYPWWLRLFASLPNIDYNAPIKDHDCDLYIERLNSFTGLKK